MKKINPGPGRERLVKRAAYVFGLLVVLAGLALVVVPQSSRFAAKGPANTGHEKLACTDCHKEAPGTLRQQLQAKVSFHLGLRETDPTFGHDKVSNDTCVNCHARDQDAHPVHRFLEPRFKEAREQLGAEFLRDLPSRAQGRAGHHDADVLRYLPPGSRDEARSARCPASRTDRERPMEDLPRLS